MRLLRALVQRAQLALRLLIAVFWLPSSVLPDTAAQLPSSDVLGNALRRALRASWMARGGGAGADGRVTSGDEAFRSGDEAPPPREETVLAVDVGATRTKFLLVKNTSCTHLAAVSTARIWQDEALDGPDKFDPAAAPGRMRTYLASCGVDVRSLSRLAFSVPGTIELEHVMKSTPTVIKNSTRLRVIEHPPAPLSLPFETPPSIPARAAPSMSPRFRGFDFKEAFRDVSPAAKVSAVADNLAAALGVACQQPQLRSALVLVLGTAPAVATLFRDPSGKGKYIETAIWQSWVWFTKVKLDDPHGYCGGLKVSRDGCKLKPAASAKIPHHQARVRFALDDATWQRLLGGGCTSSLPPEQRCSLGEEEATAVWCGRVQAAVNVLAERFHSVYGAPQQIHVLGGNASRCHGAVTSAQYCSPDSSGPMKQTVPVVVAPNDAAQQLVCMSGLVYASCFKLKQVTAPGQDPLARGWTRGGEIYLWQPKGVKSEHEIAWPPVGAMRAPSARGGAAPPLAAARGGGGRRPGGGATRWFSSDDDLLLESPAEEEGGSPGSDGGVSDVTSHASDAAGEPRGARRRGRGRGGK